MCDHFHPNSIRFSWPTLRESPALNNDKPIKQDTDCLPEASGRATGFIPQGTVWEPMVTGLKGALTQMGSKN